MSLFIIIVTTEGFRLENLMESGRVDCHCHSHSQPRSNENQLNVRMSFAMHPKVSLRRVGLLLCGTGIHRVGWFLGVLDSARRPGRHDAHVQSPEGLDPQEEAWWNDHESHDVMSEYEPVTIQCQ